MESVQF